MLELKNLSLSSLPPEVGAFKQLTAVTLSGNKLTSLPKEVLTFFIILFFTPTQVGNWESVKKMWIENNELASLPEEIGGWIKLEKLYLNSNKLKSIPSGMFSSRHLFLICVKE